jgi:hypothetical protein
MCRLIVNKPASERVLDALRTVGIPTFHWMLPAELSETKVGPPIAHDDLLAFHWALAGDSWQDELAGQGL